LTSNNDGPVQPDNANLDQASLTPPELCLLLITECCVWPHTAAAAAAAINMQLAILRVLCDLQQPLMLLLLLLLLLPGP
jgi:hypothetical protein